MAYIRSYKTADGSGTPAWYETPGDYRHSFFITAWWLLVALTGLLITVFGQNFLPAKFSYDAVLIRELLDFSDLWNGFSFDGFVNTARVWAVVFYVLPQTVVIPAYYCLLVLAVVHLLGVHEVRNGRYHLIAGGWVMCSAIFLSQPSKEMIAIPVALYFCLAASGGARFLATILFLVFAAFVRQYWVICYFYFFVVLTALRMHISQRSHLALCVFLVGFILPFVAANVLGIEALTEARMSVNAERIDSPDARSAFNNIFENTSISTDIANALVSWLYINIPVALLVEATPTYVFFAAFQTSSLWMFVAGSTTLLRDAKRIPHLDSNYLRCVAFVISYSLTQAIFEPDFGSFLRHELVLMIPMLVVVFYTAHASRSRSTLIKFP